MPESDAKRPRVQLTSAPAWKAAQRTSGNSAATGNGATVSTGGAASNTVALRSAKVAGTASSLVDLAKRAVESSEATGGDSQVIVNVAGRQFRISAGLLRAHSCGLLAKRLEKLEGSSSAKGSSASASSTKTIFVDGSPDRFPLILDWYRYGEVFVPSSTPVASVLQDARWFGLPEEIIVNGVSRATASAVSSARRLQGDMVATVIAGWPDFATYFKVILDTAQKHFKELALAASQIKEGEETYDFTPCVVPLCTEKGWSDTTNVCSGARARVLALRLEEHGYLVDFTDTELVIALPSTLRGEALGLAGCGEEEEGAEPDGIAQ